MSKDEEIRNIHARRKNLLYLMERYLNDNGFYSTAAALQNEAKLSNEYELCDNIDLDGIYLEYASYYQLKFGKFPRILKRLQTPKLEMTTTEAKRKKSKQQTTVITPAAAAALEETLQAAKGVPVKATLNNVDDLQVTVTKMATQLKIEQQKIDKENLNETDILCKQSLNCWQDIQHGCPSSNSQIVFSSHEWQNLVDLVKSTIVKESLTLKWSDICGNSTAVELLKEAVITPLNYPQLFNNNLKPWRSLLLHGPPGSGKTLLAKILCAETKEKVTFFNITSSIMVSKWRGESEKLLRVLFHLALKQSPSVIFLDEIEGLTSKRDRCADHESSKRFKNELLQLMDGLEQSTTGLFILASTNLPWEIDEAFLRRFEKKILVQLPNEVERAVLIGKLLPLNVKLNESQMSLLVKLSNGFTGDEIRLACKEIAMQTVRQITKAKLKGEPALPDLPIESAFKQINPLSLNLMERHLKWQTEKGS